eukprot:2419566-Pyramimonas_sp.AAC.1
MPHPDSPPLSKDPSLRALSLPAHFIDGNAMCAVVFSIARTTDELHRESDEQLVLGSLQGNDACCDLVLGE